ncbi:hypothetical protein C8J57DRAFT_1709956 [Mycena rebaudengoi]|nr:hypothetical protein C8J57DRAFT_1709956 [Mycena rebaudengoi]
MKRLFKRTASAVSTIEPPPSSKSARIDEVCAGDDERVEDDDVEMDAPNEGKGKQRQASALNGAYPSLTANPRSCSVPRSLRAVTNRRAYIHVSTMNLMLFAHQTPTSRSGKENGLRSRPPAALSGNPAGKTNEPIVITDEEDEVEWAAPPLPIASSSRPPTQAASSRAKAQPQAKSKVEKATKRREARNAPAAVAARQSQKLDRKEALQPDIGKVWLNDFDTYIRLHTASTKAATKSTADIDIIYEVQRLAAESDHVVALSRDDPLLQSLSDERALLANCARDKCDTAIAAAISCKTVVLSPADDERVVTYPLAYVRVGRVKSTSKKTAAACQPAECVEDYARSYPSDMGWCTYRLLLCGLTPAQVSAILVTIGVDLGYSTAMTYLLDRLSKLPFARYSSSSLFLYFGVSETVTPGKRLADDLAEAAYTRFTNFAKINADVIFAAYHIPSLDRPASSGFRSDVNASKIEVLLIQLLRGSALNHATGGYIPNFAQPAWAANILATLLPPAPELHPFGEFEDPILSDAVEAALDDEKSYILNHVTGTTISHPAYQSILQNSASVIRTNGHGTPAVRMFKAITEEHFCSTDGVRPVDGMWDVAAARSLKYYRNVISVVNSGVPEEADLSVEVIASCIGPVFDFWLFILWHWLWWLHCLWRSRLYCLLNVIVAVPWSSPLFTGSASGHFHLVWKGIPESVRKLIMSGTTPPDIEKYLPPAQRTWYPTRQNDHFAPSIRIIQHGPEPTQIHVEIPSPHAGVIKYDAFKAYIIHQLLLAVEILFNTTLREVELMRRENLNPDRENAENNWRYFQKLVDRVEQKAVWAGLRAVLDDLKEQYALLCRVHGFLRRKDSMPSPSAADAVTPPTSVPRVQNPDFTIPGITNAVGDPESPERLAQYNELARLHALHQRGGGDADTYSLVPFQYRSAPYSDEMRDKWFMLLKRGCRIAASAKHYGNSAEAHAKAIASHSRLSNDKAALSAGGHATTAIKQAAKTPHAVLTNAVAELADWATRPSDVDPKTGSRKSGCLRYGTCEHCGEVLVVFGRNFWHECPITETRTHVIDSEFPNSRPLIYLHDLFHNAALVDILGVGADSFGLVPFLVRDILARDENAALVAKELPGLDMSRPELGRFVYVLEKEVSDNTLLVTLAIDVCLPLISCCPANLWPVTAEERALAWSHAGKLRSWTEGDRNFMRCDHGYCGVLKSVWDHMCEHTQRIQDSRRLMTGNSAFQVSRERGGPRDCKTQVLHRIKTVLDLPPEYNRSRWYCERILPKLRTEGRKRK